jgi:DNA processing protein
MIDWIALNMTPGVGPRAATKLLERFGSASSVFHARRGELESLRLRPETIESIIGRDLHDKAAGELDRVKALGGDVLILDDGSYPGLLREIDDPPPVLYVKGDWQASLLASLGGRDRRDMFHAMRISSRACAIWRRAASASSRALHAASTRRHRGAISGKGKKIMVLGTAFDESPHPRENMGLVRERFVVRRLRRHAVPGPHAAIEGQLSLHQINW